MVEQPLRVEDQMLVGSAWMRMSILRTVPYQLIRQDKTSGTFPSRLCHDGYILFASSANQIAMAFSRVRVWLLLILAYEKAKAVQFSAFR